MKSFTVSASVAFAVLSGLANAVKFTNTDFSVEAGQAFVLTWTEGTGPYQILLKNGPSGNLDTVETLVESTTADSTTVVLPTSLTTDVYAFEIVDTSDDSNNYSVQFEFAGSAAVSSATSATSTAASTTMTTATTATTATTSTTGTTSTTDTTSTTATTGTTTTTSGTASHSTMATSTTSGSSTKTSASSTASTSVASTNDGRGLAAPLLLAAGIALAAL
ncbi:hypothetical protein LQW54_007894 [Pestalotiopsis sp. IQ-011]